MANVRARCSLRISIVLAIATPTSACRPLLTVATWCSLEARISAHISRYTQRVSEEDYLHNMPMGLLHG